MIGWVWLGISLAAVVVTLDNLRDASRSWRAFRRNGPMRRMLARADIWLNAWLLLAAVGCVVIVIPSLGRPGDVALSPFIVAAMLVPAGIAGASITRRRARTNAERLVRFP